MESPTLFSDPVAPEPAEPVGPFELGWPEASPEPAVAFGGDGVTPCPDTDGFCVSGCAAPMLLLGELRSDFGVTESR